MKARSHWLAIAVGFALVASAFYLVSLPQCDLKNGIPDTQTVGIGQRFTTSNNCSNWSYAGLNGDAIVFLWGTAHGSSPIYFPANAKYVKFGDVAFTIKSVTPYEIILEHKKETADE